MKVLQQSHWVCFNNLIREANKNICLELYANATFGEVGTYTYYVRCKYVDYSPSAINSLFNLQHALVCALRNYKSEHRVTNEAMAQDMTEAFYRPWENGWLSVA